MKESIVFFGNEQLSSTRTPSTAPALRAILKAGYKIECLIIKQGVSHGRRHRQQPAVVAIAEQNGIPIHNIKSREHLLEVLESCSSQIAVLAAFGMILPKTVLDHFPFGIVNIHPSLLPKYRGSSPIESAILNGDRNTGVSLMKLTAKMDAGPILAQDHVGLNSQESKADLTRTLSETGARLLVQNLSRIISGDLQPTEQDHKSATYTNTLSKDLSYLDFTLSSIELERQIRAYADWPASRTTIGNFDVIITTARSTSGNKKEFIPGDINIDNASGVLTIECSDGYLSIQRLKPVGKNEMSAADFINGYRLEA